MASQRFSSCLRLASFLLDRRTQPFTHGVLTGERFQQSERLRIRQLGAAPWSRPNIQGPATGRGEFGYADRRRERSASERGRRCVRGRRAPRLLRAGTPDESAPRGSGTRLIADRGAGRRSPAGWRISALGYSVIRHGGGSGGVAGRPLGDVRRPPFWPRCRGLLLLAVSRGGRPGVRPALL